MGCLGNIPLFSDGDKLPDGYVITYADYHLLDRMGIHYYRVLVKRKYKDRNRYRLVFINAVRRVDFAALCDVMIVKKVVETTEQIRQFKA